MKLLLVNQTFYPDSVATAQHLTDLAIALKKQGHQVTVLTSRRGYGVPHPTYPSSEIYQGVQIIRVWPFVFSRKNKLSRAMDALCVNLAFFFRMLFLSRADTLIALTSPPLVSFFACLVAKLKKSFLVYWVMDMNPDEAVAMGWIQENSFIAKVLKWCQRFVVRRSNCVIVLDWYMRKRLLSLDSCIEKIDKSLGRGNLFSKKEKIVVVPPWSHDEVLEAVPHAKNWFRKKHGLEGKFVVMYSGNHSICHPLDTVLEAARLLANDVTVVFMFIGGGLLVRDVLEFKTRHSLNNIIQMDYIARSEIRFSLSAADLHLVVMGDNMAGIVHPCKIYGILSLGKPFAYVGPEQSHITDLFNAGAQGYSIIRHDPQKLAECIDCCHRLPAESLDAINRANIAVAKKFSAKILVSKMIQEIALVGKRSV